MPVPTSWHPGEVAAQQARGYEDDVWGGWEGYQEGAPDWMGLFLNQLPFLSVTTLDDRGRPWASLLCFDGQTGFIVPAPADSSAPNRLRFMVRAGDGVPIRETLLRLKAELADEATPFTPDGEPQARFQIGAVGVMLHNRRRNKMEGVIVGVVQAPQGPKDRDDTFVFDVEALNTFGNCPKYINTRMLLPVKETSKTTSATCLRGTRPGRKSDIPPDILATIQETDLVFLATKYSGHDPEMYMPDPPRLGNNYRGGPPGYLRTFFDDETAGGQRCVVLPDWSGNRLMMSFGNMIKDPCAGLVIPVWSTSSQQRSGVLHLTCRAQVLANDDAKALMRGVRGAVKLWIEEWTWLPQSLSLFVAQPATAHGDLLAPVGFSPYNPPVRKLHSEESTPAQALDSQSVPMAHLVDAQLYSDKVAALAFEIPSDAEAVASVYRPGMHIVMDCYELLDTRIKLYTHMAAFRGGEKDLNDDGVRSWTVTHAEQRNATDGKPSKWRFELTLRRKARGGVTPSLFRMARQLRESLDAKVGQDSGSSWRPAIRVLGTEGSSVLPSLPEGKHSPLQLVYMLSGIGITPVLPHLTQLASAATSSALADVSSMDQQANVVAIIAVRHGEAGIVQRLLHRALTRQAMGTSLSSNNASRPPRLHLEVQLLVSDRRNATEDDEGEADSSEVMDALWSSLLPTIVAKVSAVHGQRLGPDSLSPAGEPNDQQGNEAMSTSHDPPAASPLFVLPAAALQAPLARTDMALVCAGQAFARTAQTALQRAGVEEQRIHMESFLF